MMEHQPEHWMQWKVAGSKKKRDPKDFLDFPYSRVFHHFVLLELDGQHQLESLRLVSSSLCGCQRQSLCMKQPSLKADAALRHPPLSPVSLLPHSRSLQMMKRPYPVNVKPPCCCPLPVSLLRSRIQLQMMRLSYLVELGHIHRHRSIPAPLLQIQPPPSLADGDLHCPCLPPVPPLCHRALRSTQ